MAKKNDKARLGVLSSVHSGATATGSKIKKAKTKKAKKMQSIMDALRGSR